VSVKKNTTDRFNLSGVYKLQCKECPSRYIGQTGRTFKTRYKEHIRDIQNDGQYSKCAQHIIDTGHEYDTMENTMKILRTERKGQMLNAYENSIYMKPLNKVHN
jgi:predicted GIY-YIG superfamily endonuclease